MFGWMFVRCVVPLIVLLLVSSFVGLSVGCSFVNFIDWLIGWFISLDGWMNGSSVVRIDG